MAVCINFAATVESTPPETAPMTWPVGPTRARMRVISWPENSLMVQDWRQAQMMVAKLVRI